ncbi:MAG TPA: ABC transporter permease subunit [Chloroflexia bacterium]|nr:ABC transporter permease subunit [Chloroflexia bacterium]
MKSRPLLNYRVKAVIENEWNQLLRNKVIIFTTIAPPLLVVLLSIAVLLLSTFIDENISGVGNSAAALMSGEGSRLLELSGADSVQAALVSPFVLLFQLIPLVVPITIASYSIVGEKQSRSLEALLATPIRTWELLLGKALAAAIPGVLATWYSYLMFVAVARVTVSDMVFQEVVLSRSWVLSMAILTPLFTLLAVSLGIMISSKVRDPQSAQQLGSLVILPIVGALVGQLTGALRINVGLIAGTAVGLLVLDAMVLAFTVQLFGRENILTKWR